MGASLTELGRFAEAEPHLLASHQIMIATFGEEHQRSEWVRDRLANLYDAWSRPADADRYRDAP